MRHCDYASSALRCLATPEVEEAHKFHQQTMHDYLQAVIEQLLSVQVVIPDGVKPKRAELLKVVALYSESSKFSKLKDWLMSVYINYIMAQLGGEE